MKLCFCKDDISKSFFSIGLCILGEIFAFFACGWDLALICFLLLLDATLTPAVVRDYLYFSRTIMLDQEGVCFLGRGKEEKIKWDDLNVALFDRVQFMMNDGDILGPGILIYPKHVQSSGKLAPMTFCRRKCPSKSVFLRFRTDKDPGPWDTGKMLYSGYVAEKSDVMTYMERIGRSYMRCQ